MDFLEPCISKSTFTHKRLRCISDGKHFHPPDVSQERLSLVTEPGGSSVNADSSASLSSEMRGSGLGRVQLGLP